MEEPTEEIPDNLPETKVSRVAEKVKEEDIEIITKTTNIVVHSESSHVESSYVSTLPISLMEDQQTSTTTGETTKEESGTKKVVRFDEKTEFVPQGDREESYEIETKDRDADTEIQHVETAEKSQTEDALDAKKEFVAAANIPLEEETVVSVSSEVMKAAECEIELSTPKQDVEESDKHSADSPRVETVEEAIANVPEESATVNETSKPELDILKEKETSEVEETQEKSKELDEHLEPFEELLDGPLEEHQPISSSVKELKSSSKEQQAQNQDESLKEQLHGIILEIDLEVNKEDEGTARRHHTWKPKGVYKVEKTEITFEDIVPIKVDDVKIEDRPKEELPKEKETKDERKKGIKVEIEHNFDHYIQGEPSPISKLLRHCLINGEVLSPTEIPIGIPLLAKILPKEGEEDHEKIPLERLFTPASDWEEIIPHKKKAYASSCFYRPDHPTIDDQVELAHKISTSLVDETNKTSKGQTMYIKRKNRSAKWIHQAASQYDMDDNEDDEENQTKEKPPLKLVVNKKIAQDYSLIQHHYEELLSTSQTLQQISNMEVGKEIASDLQSPTGKGAALFAKRKKRMDKFIIDETTVQQQQQPQSIVHEDTKSSTTTSTTTTVNNYQTSAFESKCSSQNQKQMNSSRLQNVPAMAAPSVTKTAPIQTGGLMLPDLADILTKPKPLEKKTPSLAERGISKKKTSRSHSADSYKTTSGFQNQQFSQSQSKQTKKIPANQMIHNGPDGQLYNASSFAGHELEALGQFTNGISFQDPLENLRPGSPPTYMIPNGLESFVEHKIDHSTPQSVNGTSSSMATSNNECGAIYTAEVKVIQKPSLIPTSSIISYSAPTPQHTILSDLASIQDNDKRKSFNLAPKGWGTYNTYYTPVHLGAP